MISIGVYSHDSVDIESKNYQLHNKGDMVIFLHDLLEKVIYSGESFCLESIEIDIEKGRSIYTEIERW